MMESVSEIPKEGVVQETPQVSVSENVNAENVPEKASEEATSIEKTSKSKKTKKPSTDHVDGTTDMGDMGTLFILDLMRQKKEKMMRKKKDELINEMAMKKKQQIMDARMGKRTLTRPSFGGFVGVNAILGTLVLYYIEIPAIISNFRDLYTVSKEN